MTNPLNPARWETYIHLLVLHSSRNAVLMAETEAGFALPRIRLSGLRKLSDVEHLPVAVQNMLGMNTTALRYVHRLVDKQRSFAEAVYVMENHTPNDDLPESTRWLELKDARRAMHAIRHLQQPVVDFLAELESAHEHPSRRDWARRGWFESARDWIQSSLDERGYTITGNVTQVKSWGISCILRVATDRGSVYFKQSGGSALFGKEASVTSALASIYPYAVPAPIAIDENRQWMLLPDFGGPIGKSMSAEDAERISSQIARIQTDSASRIDQLMSIGCLDRRLGVLRSQIGPLMDDTSLLASVSELDRERLRASAGKLDSLCEELASLGIPDALVHGDLHDENIARSRDGFVFFDWTDACISHPFLDLVTLVNHTEPIETLTTQDRSQIEAYLSCWTQYAPLEQLWEAWRISRPLGALHQMISYQAIARGVEPMASHELVGGVPFWCSRLLDFLP